MKGKLSKPLKTNFIEYKNTRGFDRGPDAPSPGLLAAFTVGAIVVIPLAIISLPFQAIDSLSN